MPLVPRRRTFARSPGSISTKWAKLRKNLILGFYGVCAAGAVLLPLLLSNGAWLSGGIVGFALAILLRGAALRFGWTLPPFSGGLRKG